MHACVLGRCNFQRIAKNGYELIFVVAIFIAGAILVTSLVTFSDVNPLKYYELLVIFVTIEIVIVVFLFTIEARIIRKKFIYFLVAIVKMKVA